MWHSRISFYLISIDQKKNIKKETGFIFRREVTFTHICFLRPSICLYPFLSFPKVGSLSAYCSSEHLFSTQPDYDRLEGIDVGMRNVLSPQDPPARSNNHSISDDMSIFQTLNIGLYPQNMET